MHKLIFKNLSPTASLRLLYRLLGTGLIATLCGPALAASWYVSPNGSDANAGTQAKPLQTIQAALSKSGVSDTIWLEAGTYTGTGNIDLFIGEALNIESVSGAASTIIDCKGSASQNHRAMSFSGAGTSSKPSSLLNITLKNGYIGGSAGGCLEIDSQTYLRISGCNFNSNSVQGTGNDGGAIFEDGTSTVTVASCTFSLNSATDTGAAYYNLGTLTVGNSTFANGNSDEAGALYNNGSATLVNCVFTQNQEQGAGTIENGPGGALELDGCTITGNTGFSSSSATGSSGVFNGGKVSAYGCLFSNNSANLEGGGFYNGYGSISCLLQDCVFTGNSAPEGGAIYADGPMNIYGCTFSGNTASGTSGGGAIYEEEFTTGNVSDTIMWGDTAPATPATAEFGGFGTLFTTHSDIEQGQPGMGNIKTSPLFVSTGNYNLQATSPCLYTGTPIFGMTTDYAGRIRHNPPCMGAYEGGSVYSVVATAIAPNQNKVILWNSVAGQAVLWTVTPSGGRAGYAFGPYAGYTPVALAVGPDNVEYLTWQQASGEIAVWNVAANGTHTGRAFNPGVGWSLVSLSVGSDSALHISWQDKPGHLWIWNVTTKGVITYQEYGPE